MTWDHLDLVGRICRLSLKNAANICFANAGFYCVLWTLLSTQPFEPAFWGPHYAVLADFLMATESTISLLDATWFSDIMQCWGQGTSPPDRQQQDTSEFLYHMLRWIESSLFHMGWERRFEENKVCHIDDQSSPAMPISLCMDTRMAYMDRCYLDDLIKHWHQDRGMKTGLMRAPQCLFIQIDRMYQHTDSVVKKSKCQIYLDTQCSFPMFCNDKLGIEYVDYMTVGAIAHLGSDNAGHCRSALKIQPTVQTDGSATRWLLTEDEQPPQAVWDLPEWFTQNTVLLGLVRTDCLALHLHRTDLATSAPLAHGPTSEPATSLTESAQAILHLCQRMNTRM